MIMNCFTSILCVLGVVSTASLVYAKPATFNHSGVQVGKIVENCYHNPCSGAKIVGFKQLDKSKESSMLELTLVGYSRDWNTKRKSWNHDKHKIFVTCSIQAPTVTIDGQVTTLPINPEMVIAGVLQTDYMFYVSACHGGYMDETKLAKKFGYNVTDW